MSQDLRALLETQLGEIRRTPRERGPWFLAFMLYIRLRDYGNAMALLAARQQYFKDRVSFSFYAVREILLKNGDDFLPPFLQSIADDDPIAFIVPYTLAGLQCKQGRSDRVIAWMHEAARRLGQAADQGADDPIFCENVRPLIASQAAMLIEAGDILADPTPNLTPAVSFLNPRPRSSHGVVLLAACDERYFRIFGERLARSVSQHQPRSRFHLHVVSESDAVRQQLLSLCDRFPLMTVSIESVPAGANATYFACSRFLVGQAVADWHDAPLFALDVDLDLLRPLDDLLSWTASHDVAWFETREPLPSMVCLAGMMLINRTPAARDFLARLVRYVSARLGAPDNWMLDQAALFAISRALRSAGSSIRMGNYRERFEPLVGHFAEVPDIKEKFEARGVNGARKFLIYWS